jgi:hypothetical protein
VTHRAEPEHRYRFPLICGAVFLLVIGVLLAGVVLTG